MNKFISAILTVICSSFIIAVAFWTYRMFLYHPSVTEVNIAYVAPSDSIGKAQAISINNEVTDSLISVLKKQEEQLQTRYELFLKAREDDADITRMLSSLGAFLLALIGIFGIKSYKDFTDHIEKKVTEAAETKAIEIAQVKAEERAKDVATTTATTVAQTSSEATVRNLVESTVARLTQERLTNGTYTEELVLAVFDKVVPVVQGLMSESQSDRPNGLNPEEQTDIVDVSNMPPINNHEPSEVE